MNTRPIKQLKNLKVKRKLYKGLENDRQKHDPDSDQENTSNNNYTMEVSADRRKKYNLRGLEKKSYHDDGSEDFSPDVSEYVPSPERFKRQSFSSSSSPGGESQKVSHTPSSISNLSVILENNDIVLDRIDEADEDLYSSTSLLSINEEFLKTSLDITLKPVVKTLIDITLKPVQLSPLYLATENTVNASNKLPLNNEENCCTTNQPSHQNFNDTAELESRTKLNPEAILRTNNLLIELSPIYSSLKSSPKNACEEYDEEHTHSDPIENVLFESHANQEVKSIVDKINQQNTIGTLPVNENLVPSFPEFDQAKRRDICLSDNTNPDLTAPGTIEDEDKRQDSRPSDITDPQLTGPETIEDENKSQDFGLSDTTDLQLTAPATIEDKKDKRQDSRPSDTTDPQLTAPAATEDEDKRQDSRPSDTTNPQLTAPAAIEDEDKREESRPLDTTDPQLTAPAATEDEDKRRDSCPSDTTDPQLTVPAAIEDKDKRQDSCPSDTTGPQLTAPAAIEDKDKRQDSCPSDTTDPQLIAPSTIDDEDKRQDPYLLDTADPQLTAPEHQQQISCCLSKSSESDEIIIPFPEFDQDRSTIFSRYETEENQIKPREILDDDTNIENSENEYMEIVIIQESDQSLDNISVSVHEDETTSDHQTDENNEENLPSTSETINKDQNYEIIDTENLQVIVIHENQAGNTDSNFEIQEVECDPESAFINTPKRLSRKRVRNENEWCDRKNKKFKDSGEKYVGCRTKKTFPKKEMKPVCNCAKNCSEKITTEQRESIFKKYYQLADHELQWQFIHRNTRVENVKRITVERTKNRTQSIKYSFNIDGLTIPVCKVYFLNTLSISEQTVYTALEKIKKDKSLTDERGNHCNRPHKMSPATEENIVTHIQLFPTVESHYVRKDSKRQYLSENLNISKMYRLYKAWFSKQNYTSDQLASKRQYETIFNTKFNYSFFKPKKDLCATCSLYQQAEETKRMTLEESYKKHIQRKEKVRDIKKEEKKEVANRTDTTIAIFDLEKVINIPQSEVGIFHYKRKYPIYNLTVFDATRRLGYCYVWHLNVAKRGAIEVGSCLLQFMTQQVQKGIKKISFYSDGCAGQNKNRFIFALHLYAAKTFELEITHRFYETGHSQNEGDCMHSCIEKELKNKTIYTPDQVYGLIMNAKKSGEKYQVKEMQQADILDIKELVSDQDWIRDTEGKKISWTKVMEVRVSPSKPDVLEFKYDFNEEYSQLNTAVTPQVSRKTRSRRPATASSATSNVLTMKRAYNLPVPISKLLHTDLMSLCDSEAIPNYYRPFYESLVCVDGEVLSEDE